MGSWSSKASFAARATPAFISSTTPMAHQLTRHNIFATTDSGTEANKDFKELDKKFGIKIKENPD